MLDPNIIRINGQYRLGSPFANGASGTWLVFPYINIFLLLLIGQVFHAHNISNGKSVAVKLEDFDSDPSQVEREYTIYQRLGHRAGIPKILWFGREGEYNALVMELLGSSLHGHMIKHGLLPLATSVSVAVQVVHRCCMPSLKC